MKPIFTIGHSTRTVEALIEILQEARVKQVLDIRSFPGSRYNPQFNIEVLPESLAEAEISYISLREIGGRRQPQINSLNTGWKNKSFQAYADFMQTDAFWRSLEKMISLSQQKRSALLCAEALPWKCHRFLVSDALVMKKYSAIHLLALGKSIRHHLNPLAVIANNKIIYPPEAQRACP